MLPVARKGDPTAHGGAVAEGSPDTSIGGQPAARLLDRHLCPVHGPGPVTASSSTVFVNGFGIARVGDPSTCAAPASGAGGGKKWERTALEPSRKVGVVGREGERVGRDGTWQDTHDDFRPVLSQERARVLWRSGNRDEKTRAFETNLHETRAELAVGAELAALRDAKLRTAARVVSDYDGARRQKRGTTRRGAEGLAEVKVLSAQADAGVAAELCVEQGKLVGAFIEASAGVGASAAQARVAGKTRWLSLPFLNHRIRFGGEIMAALLSAEARIGAFAGKKDHGWSFGLGAKAGVALLGLGFRVLVEIEKIPAPAPAPPPPGVSGAAGIDPIVSGCPTVLVGDAPPPFVAPPLLVLVVDLRLPGGPDHVTAPASRDAPNGRRPGTSR